jgi:hypothetical protein
MYTPLNPCTAFLHLLLKHPILIIGIGIVTAFSLAKNKDTERIEKLVQSDTSWVNSNLSDSAFDMFLKIIEVESGIVIKNDSNSDPFDIFSKIYTEEKNLGKHNDGVSYGPAGLTKIALKSMTDGKCGDMDYILNDPSLSTSYAYVYFLNLLHIYKDMKYAIIAYNFGTTRVSKFLKENKELPQDYYNKVINVRRQ